MTEAPEQTTEKVTKIETTEVLDAPTEKSAPAVAEYTTTEAGLSELRSLIVAGFNVSTKEGLKAAKAAKTTLTKLRTALEAKRVEIKAPVLERGRLIDAEAERIKGELTKLETPLALQIKAEEDRLAAIKAEAERVEKQRVDECKQRIEAIKAYAGTAANSRTGEMVQKLIDRLKAVSLDGLDEFTLIASTQLETTLKAMEEIRDAKNRDAAEREAQRVAREQAEQRAKDAEAEIAAMRKQQAEIEAQRKADADALQAERDELARLRAQLTAPPAPTPEPAPAPAPTPAPAPAPTPAPEPEPTPAPTPAPFPTSLNDFPANSEWDAIASTTPEVRTVAAEGDLPMATQQPSWPKPAETSEPVADMAVSFWGEEKPTATTPTAAAILEILSHCFDVTQQQAAAWVVASIDEITQLSKAE